ncbi:MAG: hypothetical protein PVF68_16350 [Acidobacteriota bacterium]
MNWPDVLLWGFIATSVQTGLEAGSQRLGLSRISIPFVLGTVFTANRDRAALIGFGTHLLNGWLVSLLYAAVFRSLGENDPWIGLILGVVHGLLTLLVVAPLLPAVHPRMASEHQAPDPRRTLEPPGWLALNYGRWTALSTLAGHAVFGVILGSFYHLPA